MRSTRPPHIPAVPVAPSRRLLWPQSEYGDIYKATLETDGETVTEVKLKYFDTLPPCASLAVLKTGFLFAASESGSHALYQFIVSRGGRSFSRGLRCRLLFAFLGRGALPASQPASHAAPPTPTHTYSAAAVKGG